MINYTNSATIYVSATEGNDTYTGFAPHPMETEIGSVEGPIRTLGRLMKLLTGLRVPSRGCPVTVCIEGDHFLDAPLDITLAPSLSEAGYTMSDITLESYGEKRARLIGGRDGEILYQ